MNPTVVVLDHGSGNVRSVVRALEAQGADVSLTADPDAVTAADGLVVPGVGAFRHTMEGLVRVGAPRLIERRLAGGRPVLGVCVGLQVMFDGGIEHGDHTDGLAQWPGLVTRLEAPVVPHMGWNTVEPPAGSVLFEGLDGERFYFVHSYAAKDLTVPAGSPLTPPRVAYADHGERFVAAVENGPLSATQFHPEKSGEAGGRLLANWLRSLPGAGEAA